MKTFKQFLAENRWEEKHEGSYHLVKHTGYVGDHHVEIGFSAHKKRPGKYEIGFSVDGKVSKGASSVSSEKAPHVLKHVENKVRDFVDKHKPHTLVSPAFDSEPTARSQKERLYHRMVSKLGLKTGKSIHTDE